MTVEEACAFVRDEFYSILADHTTPLGEAALAALVLDWAVNENEIDVEATITEARRELVACLARCSPDELGACLAVGDADLREAALLALGQLAS